MKKIFLQLGLVILFGGLIVSCNDHYLVVELRTDWASSTLCMVDSGYTIDSVSIVAQMCSTCWIKVKDIAMASGKVSLLEFQEGYVNECDIDQLKSRQEWGLDVYSSNRKANDLARFRFKFNKMQPEGLVKERGRPTAID